ncbi:anti-sigma factor [Sphingobacterium sp. InxBP1]|uniref:anti-sigma factor n=1 Tax=Sphingobacterium sp. InxBP1 TaxID=2870328 RepID=UPI0022442E9E|nr:anti-sigma factor [Sphingobacterium sp. InxBP1]MCW8313410.1 anti-sigma factor [Sphingobacterium sp. InxBP1]
MDIKAYISSGIIESYVLGLASEEEVSILNCIRKNNVEVEQAILEAEKALEGLADTQAMPVPLPLKQMIWNRLEAESQRTSEEEVDSIDEHTITNAPLSVPEKEIGRISNRRYSWAVAASILLALSAAANVFLYLRNDQTEHKLEAASASLQTQEVNLTVLQDKWNLVRNPMIKTISLKGVGGKQDLHALVFWDQASKAVYLSLERMPAVPKGKQYQLWAMVDGKPLSAGVFPLGIRTDSASQMLTVPKAQAFAITLEDEGGKEVPNLNELRVMGSI